MPGDFRDLRTKTTDLGVAWHRSAQRWPCGIAVCRPMQRPRSIQGLGVAAFVDRHSASRTNGRTGVSCRCLADTGFRRTSALRGGGVSRAFHLNRKRKDIFVAITSADNRESERAFVQDRQGQRYLR